MSFINILSLLLLLIFVISYSLKLVYLNIKKIKANQLAKRNKPVKIFITELNVKIASFLWLITWFSYNFFENKINTIIPMLFNNVVIQYIGVIITSIGLMIFIIAMLSMKKSWRVGIDKNSKAELIKTGIYKISRNPAFVGFDLMFIGFFITYTSWITLFIMIFNLISFHFLILQEEKHLKGLYGNEYLDYMNLANRYL